MSFNRDTFLHAITERAEVVARSKLLGFSVPIRELTVAQRLAAVDAAKVYDSAGAPIPEGDGVKTDPSLYWAAIVVQGVLDPATALDAAGNILPLAGTPLLTPLDIPTLAEEGREALQQLAQEIINLSWLTKDAIFLLYPKIDTSKPDTGARAGDGGRDVGDDVQPRTSPSSDGGVVGDGVEQGIGDDIPAV